MAKCYKFGFWQICILEGVLSHHWWKVKGLLQIMVPNIQNYVSLMVRRFPRFWKFLCMWCPKGVLQGGSLTFTCELAIMLAAALVTTHHTLDILILIVILRTTRLATIRPGSGALLQLPQTRADTRGHERQRVFWHGRREVVTEDWLPPGLGDKRHPCGAREA